MAFSTGVTFMLSGFNPECVAEGGTQPRTRIVAGLASLWKSNTRMTRSRGVVIVRHMTSTATVGDANVVKTTTEPGCRIVTRFTGGRQSHGRMIGIGRVIVIGHMTRITVVSDTGMVKASAHPGDNVVAIFTCRG